MGPRLLAASVSLASRPRLSLFIAPGQRPRSKPMYKEIRGTSWSDREPWEGELCNGSAITELPPAKTVTRATSDGVTGKCPGGTSRRRDLVTSGDFRSQSRREGGEDTQQSGDAERQQQEGRGEVCEEEVAEVREDVERQQQEERGEASEKEDTEVRKDPERQQQAGRDDAREEEDRERRVSTEISKE
ncbi:hypothetical protein NDU88_005461 [Pleurodeles waltl]|uniref:Uncharacterized protein n=1 Tax=Pleurodeles waltl TaxID=8319 RepID=A0AAV7TVN4_PLEWA|nr:hypothetical protein NDU88_005461 [Pleurodeles waltl]